MTAQVNGLGRSIAIETKPRRGRPYLAIAFKKMFSLKKVKRSLEPSGGGLRPSSLPPEGGTPNFFFLTL
jgi:hypothetical protein